jgi:hypothetical protein
MARLWVAFLMLVGASDLALPQQVASPAIMRLDSTEKFYAAAGSWSASVPGNASTLLWATSASPAVPAQGEAISAKTGYVPGPGETRLMFVTFPPDAVMMSPSFNPAAAGAEFMEHMPELASKFEMDNPGMHTTDTVDYGIVLEGEIWLEVDDGKQVHLQQHDVVVQNGTRHA